VQILLARLFRQATSSASSVAPGFPDMFDPQNDGTGLHFRDEFTLQDFGFHQLTESGVGLQ